MADDLPQEVRAFLAEYEGIFVERLRPGTRLEEDLGMTGDDAADFLREFAKRFGVELSGLEFHKHFGPEGCNLLWLLYTPAWLRDHGNYSVTVDHLVRVAEVKRWFSPPRVGGRWAKSNQTHFG
jgi:Protein of unknown function (DUF1493)